MLVFSSRLALLEDLSPGLPPDLIPALTADCVINSLPSLPVDQRNEFSKNRIPNEDLQALLKF